MLENNYSNIQFFVWVFLIPLATYLLLGKISSKDTFTTYKKSRRSAGIALFIYCLQFYIQWKYNVRDNHPLIASALNITFFYLTAVLLSFSFNSLLNKSFWNKQRIITHFSLCFAVAAIVWCSIFLGTISIAKYTVMLAAVWLYTYVSYVSWLFIGAYKDSVEKIQNYYSDHEEFLIRWMSKCVFLAILMGILSPILAFAPKWIITLYLISSIPFFFYIFCSFVDYTAVCELVDNAIKIDKQQSFNNDEFCENISSNLDKHNQNKELEEKIQLWINAKGYYQSKINMGDLAKLFDTNRSYLSNYINLKYSCTFYKWIAALRIQAAKEILLNEYSCSTAQIADRLGFSSSSHFIKIFTEQEQISPIKWKEEQLTKLEEIGSL
ncbi:MAG: helix-turn-helix domain-containing protein [Marinifilaceae bacterium]